MFLAVADMHLRREDKVWLGKIPCKGDISFAMDQLIEIVRQRKPEIIVLCGDVFDEKVISAYELFLISGLISAASSVGSKLWFIQGQHEYSNPPILSVLAEIARKTDSICHIDKKVIKINGLKIAGLDILLNENKYRFEEPIDIVFTHQVWKEIFNAGHTLSLDDLSARLVISGDFHAPISIDGNNSKLISVGSIYPNSISEVQNKGILWINEDLSHERILLKSRTIARIDLAFVEYRECVNKIESIMKECESLPENIKKPIIVLMFDDQTASTYRKLINEYGDDVNFVAKQSNSVKLNEVNTPKFISVEELIDSVSKSRTAKNIAVNCWMQNSIAPLKSYIDKEDSSEVDDAEENKDP